LIKRSERSQRTWPWVYHELRSFCRQIVFLAMRRTNVNCEYRLYMSNQEKLCERLELLRAEHRDLDDAIVALSQRSLPDMIQLARLKKKKLQLRDDIIRIESVLLPDIIA